MIVTDYVFYEGALTVTLHTARLNPQPATIFVAGDLHSEYLAKIRSALREYRVAENLATGLQAYLPVHGGFPLYGIRAIRPAGSQRSVDNDFGLEVSQQRFALQIAMLETTFTDAPERFLAIERNIEKAAKDLLTANALPSLVIPGDQVQLGETFVDIMFELGPATEQGDAYAPAG